MRKLNLIQSREKLLEYSSDIETSSWELLHQKIVQLWGFINDQPILRSILERIYIDYREVFELGERRYSGYEGPTHEYLNKIREKENHGVFSLLLVRKAVESARNHPEIYDISRFYKPEKYNIDSKNNFIELAFKPFVELLLWYLDDKKSESINDYFAIEEANETNAKLDEILNRLIELEKLPLGQEIIFDEINELKELTKELKKKHWLEILRGKLLNMLIEKIISPDTFDMIISSFTGSDVKLLGS